MNYEVLSRETTDIWLANFQKVIDLAEKLNLLADERLKRMDREYTAKYQTGWRKFFYESDYWISYSGYAYPLGSLFKCKGVESLSYPEIRNRAYVYEYQKLYKKEYKNTQERWAKYAKQPFEVHESDIQFYQQMKHFHEYSIVIAKGLGINCEAFNLDEDSQHSS